MTDPAADALSALGAQGVVGAVAVLLALSLAYVMKRFLAHLEMAEERAREIQVSHTAILGEIASTLNAHEQRVQLHVAELNGRLTGLTREVEISIETSKSAAVAAQEAAKAAAVAAGIASGMRDAR